MDTDHKPAWMFSEHRKASKRKWNKANPRRVRDNELKRRYGISLEQWLVLFDEQDRSCAICKTKDPGSVRGWHTDHDHNSPVKTVRGILCKRCNMTLGHCEDNTGLLGLMIEYLQKGAQHG